jgi:hypothetical protein
MENIEKGPTRRKFLTGAAAALGAAVAIPKEVLADDARNALAGELDKLSNQEGELWAKLQNKPAKAAIAELVKGKEDRSNPKHLDYFMVFGVILGMAPSISPVGQFEPGREPHVGETLRQFLIRSQEEVIANFKKNVRH